MAKEPYDLKDNLFANSPKNGKYYLIAIDGRGGAGKTSLSNYLEDLLPDFSLICGDEYFEPVNHPIAWGGYNEDRFYKDVIGPLRNAQTEVNFRPYDWDHEPHIKDHKVVVDKGVLIDRCYSFTFDLNYDLKIWVETDREVALKRGVGRSTMPKEQAEIVWRELWKPMEDRYIEETEPKTLADIVVYGTLDYDQQII